MDRDADAFVVVVVADGNGDWDTFSNIFMITFKRVLGSRKRMLSADISLPSIEFGGH